MLTGLEVEVNDTDVSRALTDGCPIMFEESATVPLSLPVVVNTGGKPRLMLDGRSLRRWSPSLMGVAVLRDDSILNLTVV